MKTSSNQAVFEESKEIFQDAIKKAKYNYELKWDSDVRNVTKNRRRNAIWFNIPWSNTIKTPIGKEVLKLVDKWFVANPDLCLIA